MSAVTQNHLENDEENGAVVQRGPLELTVRRLVRDRASLVAACFIVFLVAFAIGAPLVADITGHTAIEQYRKIGMSPMGLPVGPDHNFWLGADHLGRDVLVRLAYGARISLIVGVVASLAAAMIGITIGTISGYAGGKTDMVLSRIMDLVMSVPFLLCALALVSVFGPSLSLSIGVIVFFSWTTMGRVIRAEVTSLRRREFVAASRSLGAGPVSIILRDILPNLSVPIIVYTTMMIPTAIVFEATLSFLGLGIVPPTPSWGGMLADASANSIYLVAWWLVVFPGLALLLTTLAFNILGDGLRDALDPKARPVRKSLLKRLKKEAR
ncbi:ABC transporter permease [Martelella mediterranea]|uniref:Peptide/nickel transport system permease protein/oligopeptide transport system permease protein n=1 Tax=Martelella mediterranea TaxID=293089 RepID=A0A4R3NGS9_9HYPH|nr:ABC transporter permease [Martelella mediterranea]TCT31763.1 peptide/nickel transport system permease protein/oligopeptide transport system permease protein [Martelella mediterranea]